MSISLRRLGGGALGVLGMAEAPWAVELVETVLGALDPVADAEGPLLEWPTLIVSEPGRARDLRISGA